MSKYEFKFEINSDWIDDYLDEIKEYDFDSMPTKEEMKSNFRKFLEYDIKQRLECRVDEINKNYEDMKILKFNYDYNYDKVYVTMKLEICNDYLNEDRIYKHIYRAFNIVTYRDEFCECAYITITMFSNKYIRTLGYAMSTNNSIHKLSD